LIEIAVSRLRSGNLLDATHGKHSGVQ
jgi:hypothetical protein